MTTITLTDAAGTPVNHSFVLASFDSLLTKWRETAGGIGIGMPEVTMSLTENTNDTNRLKGKLVIPTLETVSGDSTLGFVPAPQVAYENLATFDIVMPGRSTLQNRKDLLAMFRDLLSDALVTAAVETFVKPT
jgi:hypothetical protein